MSDQPEFCGRTDPHPSHKFMRGRRVSRCPGADDAPPMRAAIDAQPAPLATLQSLAAQFEQLAQDADNDVERDNYHNEQARFAVRCTAAAWRHAARLTRQTLADLDNPRTTPNNPSASGDIRRRALARNAVAITLHVHGEWLPLSVREAVADAVLAAADQAADTVLEQRINDARSQSVPAVADAPDTCRVCGTTKRLYWRGAGTGLLYCTDCEACDCGQSPCTRTGINNPAARDAELEQLRKERDMLGRENDRLRRDWTTMRDRAEAANARVRDAIHIADDVDVTDWQRGFRACADRINAALDGPQETP